jgi:FlaG/FlaF family flagellin (archaellin)
MQQIRRDTRGISTVIAAVLGLVIVVVIVTNVFLWNYTMNQLDYDKMKEDISIVKRYVLQ